MDWSGLIRSGLKCEINVDRIRFKCGHAFSLRGQLLKDDWLAVVLLLYVIVSLSLIFSSRLRFWFKLKRLWSPRSSLHWRPLWDRLDRIGCGKVGTTFGTCGTIIHFSLRIWKLFSERSITKRSRYHECPQWHLRVEEDQDDHSAKLSGGHLNQLVKLP